MLLTQAMSTCRSVEASDRTNPVGPLAALPVIGLILSDGHIDGIAGLDGAIRSRTIRQLLCTDAVRRAVEKGISHAVPHEAMTNVVGGITVVGLPVIWIHYLAAAGDKSPWSDCADQV